MTTLGPQMHFAAEVVEALQERVAALEAAGDRLEDLLRHNEFCGIGMAADVCDCGLSSALSAWREARG
jgi:hypothetical protein